MRLFPSRLAAVCAAVVLIANLAAAQEIKPFSRRNAVTEAVAKTKAAVVTIKVPRPGGGKDMIGTGVIVDSQPMAAPPLSPPSKGGAWGGYVSTIITNNHVVGACKTPKVVLADGTQVVAEVLFAEARWDLAALRIRTDEELQELTLTKSDDLMVGETVIAIGHPFGYSNTVSTGIVSALDREITMNGDVLAGLIQTTASINPGNSGGPLLNINGELIGLNCALREGAQGIAFAINANTVKSALSTVLSAKRLAKIDHGLVCQERILAETGDRQRVVVESFNAGDVLKTGDEIRTVGERTVVNAFDVERALWNSKPGDRVKLNVEREGKSLVVELTLGASTGAGQTASAHATETQPVAMTPTAKSVGASER